MTDILEQLNAVIEKGDEKAVRAFVIAHFAELPEAMQKELAVEMFKEAMEKDFKEKKEIVEMKKEAVEAIDLIEELEQRPTVDGI